MNPDATSLAEGIRSGALRAADVVDAALAAVAADTCNAFTVVTADAARAAAAEVDAGLRTGPLAGVPISVKDHVWLAGLPATNGSRALADFVPTQTCVGVQRLLDAGAVVVGKTNNPEFCYRGVTTNDLHGTTRNPRDPSRTAGGSSGGAAASVAAGLVPLAVGTDGGGSIRIPSAFCGTYGLKPTFGLVPKMPGFRGWPTLSVTGPIATSVRDLALAVSVMAGPSGADLLSAPTVGTPDHLGAVEAPSWRGLRVAVSADLGFATLDPDVRSAFDAAVDAIASAGAEIVTCAPPSADPTALWDAIALPEGYASEGPLIGTHRELVGDDAAALTLAGRDVSARDYLDAQQARAGYAQQWSQFFDGVDAVITPAMPVTAFPTGRLAPETIDGVPVPDAFDAWCALALPANLAGLPAVCVPIGTGRDGLPVAAQVMSTRWADATALRGGAAGRCDRRRLTAVQSGPHPFEPHPFEKRTVMTQSVTSAPHTVLHHPVVVAAAEKRAASLQLTVADAITKFAGSMMFVYVHIVVFAVWMLVIEKNPWPTLTLVVSLEAIFLSTFVMIGQNRQAAFQQAKADHDFAANELELHTNTVLTQAIHEMTQQLHHQICPDARPGTTPGTVRNV